MSAAQAFWTAETDGHMRAVFAAQGVHCASCTRTIERAVRALPGIEQVNANAATGRVSVDWKTGATALPQILQAIEQVGFKPIPMAGEGAESGFQRERRTALKRIGLAGLGMMQVMMYVLGVYIAEPGDLDSEMASFLNYTAMLITLPVLVYSGFPYFQGAWHGLRRRALNMDLTVALALLLAFGASVFNTIRAEGQTYFDSVTMFVFFLGTGRYLEMVVRNRSLSTSEALTRSLPATAARLRADGSTDKVPIRELRIGDHIRIAKGAVVPVDAELSEAGALLDEALITGESCATHKRTGEVLLGGSINLGTAIVARVRQDVAGSTLASIVALLERAQRERPPVAQLADRIAAWFIAAILLITVLVAGCWLLVDPSRAFPAALAVLVVTCPCALSLATPTAIAAATTRLARMGLLVTRADALERLSIVDTVVLDKTGTLTSGATGIVEVRLQGSQNQEEALAIAAALERGSSHPIAAAFAPFATPSVQASREEEITGRGIEGWIERQRWRIGRPDFVLEIAGAGDHAFATDALVLGNEAGLVASFELGEQPRADALAAVAALRTLGLISILASGDRREAVKRIARQLGISRAEGRLEPQEKISLLHVVQARGARVLAVGDGINDGPVLAAADVSCAMGQGSAIAQAASDLLLLNDSLRALPLAVQTAQRMRIVIRQNLRWALFYNLAAVPLAAFGLIAPWVAAIGMSVSSLVVVLNARRLSTPGDTR